MEIVARPRRGRGRRALGRALVALSVFVVVLLLTPAALGLERHVVRDHAMDGTLARGSLVFDDRVPVEELRVGDVITFHPPGAPERLVTRRIVGLRGDLAVTRGDARAAADPWLLPLDAENQARVAVAVPWLGHPWLLLGGLGPFGWLLAVVGGASLIPAGRLIRARGGPVAEEPTAAVRAPADTHASVP